MQQIPNPGPIFNWLNAIHLKLRAITCNKSKIPIQDWPAVDEGSLCRAWVNQQMQMNTEVHQRPTDTDAKSLFRSHQNIF